MLAIKYVAAALSISERQCHYWRRKMHEAEAEAAKSVTAGEVLALSFLTELLIDRPDNKQLVLEAAPDLLYWCDEMELWHKRLGYLLKFDYATGKFSDSDNPAEYRAWRRPAVAVMPVDGHIVRTISVCLGKPIGGLPTTQALFRPKSTIKHHQFVLMQYASLMRSWKSEEFHRGGILDRNANNTNVIKRPSASGEDSPIH